MLEKDYKEKSNLYKIYLRKRNKELNDRGEIISGAGGRMAMIADEYRNMSKEQTQAFKDEISQNYKQSFMNLSTKWDDEGWHFPDFLNPEIAPDSVAG